jgi:acyl-CoA thioesterase
MYLFLSFFAFCFCGLSVSVVKFSLISPIDTTPDCITMRFQIKQKNESAKMSDDICALLMERSKSEPFGRLLDMTIIEAKPGFATIRMTVKPEFANLFGSMHGGALFALMDEAFQVACNTHGELAVALNVSITYAAAPETGATLEATAREIYKTRRTASYLCEVRQMPEEKLIVTAQALAYRTGKDLRTVIQPVGEGG